LKEIWIPYHELGDDYGVDLTKVSNILIEAIGRDVLKTKKMQYMSQLYFTKIKYEFKNLKY